jgi:HD-like signal output (HDOD) protein
MPYGGVQNQQQAMGISRTPDEYYEVVSRVVIDAQSKKESLASCIRLIHGQSDLPAFSHHMVEVRKAMGDEGATLNLLTNLILKNVSLTTRVLRLANSVQYNPRGKPILSVSRAVTMMGWDAISHLAVGVLVFEHFRNQSDKLKELTLLMMLSANHARQIAVRSGLRGVEEAYLCGLFRNLGELMVACYLPAEYARIAETLQGDLIEGEVCEGILQFRYEDLGKEIARRWNLPDTVVRCMDTPAFTPPRDDLERLRVISAFSHGLSTAVYRKDRSECESALKALLRRYDSILPVKASEIPAILESAAFETEDTFRAARLPMDRAGLGKQILAATGRAPSVNGSQCAEPAVEGSPDILDKLVSEVRVMLGSGEDFDLNSALMMILEAIYRGVGLDRVLFCLVDAERTWVQARLGVGADVEPLIDRFRFPISIRSGPIASALLGKEDVILDEGTGACYRRSAFVRVVGTTCFGVLPLLVDGIAVGCLYFDSASERFAIDFRARRAIAELRNFAVQAILRKRR